MVSSTDTTVPSLNLDEVVRWGILTMLDSPGYAVVSSPRDWVPGSPYSAWSYDTQADDFLDQFAGHVEHLHDQGEHSIYLRTSSIKERLRGGRGKTIDTAYLPNLWLDMDINGPGHKPKPVVPGQPPALPLPPDETTCWKILNHSGVMMPTLWVHSGGGLYPYWFFKSPLDLRNDDTRELAHQLSEDLHTVINRAAADIGWRYDTGTHDMARIMRIPGTVNKKVPGEANWTQARFFHEDENCDTFTYEEMRLAVDELLDIWPDKTPPPPPRPAPRPLVGGEVRPGDAYNRDMADPATCFHELLEPAGWTLNSRHGEEWLVTRPGKPTRDGHSATLNYQGSGNLYVFSTDAGLPTQEPISPFALYAHLTYGNAGSEAFRRATRDLSAKGYGTPLSALANYREPTRATGFSGMPSAQEILTGTPYEGTYAKVDAQQAAVASLGGAEVPPSDPEPAGTVSGGFPRREMTDGGNAWRLWDRFRHIVRWVSDERRWVKYDGQVWGRDSMDQTKMTFMAMEMVSHLRAEEAHWYSDLPGQGSQGRETMSDQARFFAFVDRSGSEKSTTAMLKMLRGMPGIEVSRKDFDANPWLLNCTNGTLNLKTAQLQPFNPDDLISRQAKVNWNGNAAPGTKMDDFLTRVLPNAGTRGYLQEALGYTISGDISLQSMFTHLGSGANGKSVMMKLLSKLLGNYAQMVPTQAVNARVTSAASPDIARMQGLRFLLVQETQQGLKLDEEKVKSLSSETQVARALYGDFQEFEPVGKLHLVTNHMPWVSDSPATWRRMNIIPWNVIIPEEEQNPNLVEEIFAEEGEYLLLWAVQGLQRLLARGRFLPPEEIVKAKEETRGEMDTLGQFIDERCEDYRQQPDGLDVRVTTHDIYQAYRNWAEQNGYAGKAILVKPTFIIRMKDKGFTSWRSRTTRGLEGIKVRPYQVGQWVVGGQRTLE